MVAFEQELKQRSRPMTLARAAMLGLCAIQLVACGDPAAPDNVLSATFSVAPDVVRRNSPILVEMTVTNHSVRDLYFWGEPNCLMSFEIADSLGTQSVGRPAIRRLCSTGLVGRPLRAGETYTETCEWYGDVRENAGVLAEGRYRLRFSPCVGLETSVRSVRFCAPAVSANVEIAID